MPESAGNAQTRQAPLGQLVSVVEAAHTGTAGDGGRGVRPSLLNEFAFQPGSDFPGILLGARVDSPAKQSLT